ncbi:MAG: UTP--glucose-1-phosphate uridylyltransferase [Clostridia bacterium]|nr:UTP--glucose-1-phosphate uridylyltransferase [Clostridia bacterium]
MIKKAVVLCGGLATRFLPFCKSIPKEMLPLIDKPLIQVIVEQLSEAGITDIMIILGRNKECIVNHFDRNIELEERLKATNKTQALETIKRTENLANIYFKRQIVPKGTGHAINMAKDWVNNEPFVMCFGDETFYSDSSNVFKELIHEYEKHGDFVISTVEVAEKDIPLYGIVKRETNDSYYKIEEFVEKPSIEKAPSNIANAGPAVLDGRIFDYIDKCPEVNLEVGITDAYCLAIHDGFLYGKMLDNFHKLDLGNKKSFITSNIYMALKNEDIKEEIVEYIKNLDLK